MAYKMTLVESFEVAINDAINMYVRQILLGSGFLTEQSFEGLRTKEMLEEKYKLARSLGAAWAKKVVDENISE